MSDIVPLFGTRQQRIAELRQWFIDQAQEPSGHVAAVSVTITGNGMVNTSGCGIEPEHAAVILDELKGVAARLEAISGRQQPAQVRRGEVISFFRSKDGAA